MNHIDQITAKKFNKGVDISFSKVCYKEVRHPKTGEMVKGKQTMTSNVRIGLRGARDLHEQLTAILNPPVRVVYAD